MKKYNEIFEQLFNILGTFHKNMVFGLTKDIYRFHIKMIRNLINLKEKKKDRYDEIFNKFSYFCELKEYCNRQNPDLKFYQEKFNLYFHKYSCCYEIIPKDYYRMTIYLNIIEGLEEDNCTIDINDIKYNKFKDINYILPFIENIIYKLSNLGLKLQINNIRYLKRNDIFCYYFNLGFENNLNIFEI